MVEINHDYWFISTTFIFLHYFLSYVLSGKTKNIPVYTGVSQVTPNLA